MQLFFFFNFNLSFNSIQNGIFFEKIKSILQDVIKVNVILRNNNIL